MAVLDVDSGERLSSFFVPPLRCMVWAPDGKLLATGSTNGQVHLWNGDCGTLQCSLDGAPGPIADLAFLLEGAYLAAWTEPDVVLVWRVNTGQLVLSHPPGAEGLVATTSRRARSENRSHPRWFADRLAALDDALDPDGPRDEQRFEMVSNEGCLSVNERVGGTTVACFPANETMLAHPSELIWAGGPIHLQLEG